MSASSLKLFHCIDGFHQYHFHCHLKIHETKWVPVKAQTLIVIKWYSKTWAKKEKENLWTGCLQSWRKQLRQWWSHGCSHYLPWGFRSSDDLYVKMFSSWIGSILWSPLSSEGWRESFCKDQGTTNSAIINLAIILKPLQCGFKRSFL